MKQSGINQARLVENFLKMVRIDSETFGERALADYVKGYLAELGFIVTEQAAALVHETATAGNLFAKLDGVGEAVLFSAHLDTVKPGIGKQPVVNGDIIKTAGDTVLGADDCAGLAAILEAMTCLVEQALPHPPIELILTVAEEVYLQGARGFDFDDVTAKMGYVLDLSGPVGGAAYAAPSIFSIEVDIRGVSAHAGFAPERGMHAIQAAAAWMTKLPWGHIAPSTTANIGIIAGGKGRNIVPNHCCLQGEVRSLVHQHATQAVEAMQRAAAEVEREYGVTMVVSAKLTMQAYEVSRKAPVAKRYQAACTACGITPEFKTTLGGSDNNVFCAKGIEGLVVACGMHEVHTTDEYTTIADLTNTASLTLALCNPYSVQ